jgi:hypothetical protein
MLRVVAYHDREDLVGFLIGGTRQFGRPVDGLHRAHRVTMSVGPALLDPSFASTDGPIAVGGGVSWTYDNRDDWQFPLHGTSFSIGTDGGGVPGSDRRWYAARASATGVTSPHPRIALAASANAGIGTGDVDHRLFPLGGHAALASLDPEVVIGTRRVVGRFELRAAPIRGAAVPVAGIVWGTELQLLAGAETGIVWKDDTPLSASGVTAGTAVAGEWLGVYRAMLGVTAGVPLEVRGFDLPDDTPPFEWTVRFDQQF